MRCSCFNIALFSLRSPPLHLLLSHKSYPPPPLPPHSWSPPHPLSLPPPPPPSPFSTVWPYVCFPAGETVQVRGRRVQTDSYWHKVGTAQCVMTVCVCVCVCGWVSGWVAGNQSLLAETSPLSPPHLSEDDRGQVSDRLPLSLSSSFLLSTQIKRRPVRVG